MPFFRGFLLSLSLCLDIGVANIAMITLAMQRGLLPGLYLGLGTCLGDLIYAILALAGMAVLLQYPSVRWALWIGGSLLLIYFTVKMCLNACRANGALPSAASVVPASGWREFGRGVFLAMSSPTAILWFAAVGGALISQAGAAGGASTGWFLAGFFSAGVLWCVVLCLVACQGGKLLGERLLRYCYWISAVIFAYFAVIVMTSGYAEFITAGA